jgi:hypothetical protein
VTTGFRTLIRNRLPIALIALGIGFTVGWTLRPPDDGAHHHHHNEGDFHAWMHENLVITPEQERLLAPFEKSYETERQQWRDEIGRAGRDLAEAIRNTAAPGPEMEAALSRLNVAQGALQRATLDHFFTMKQHLSPDQAERMRTWTHDRLLHDR